MILQLEKLQILKEKITELLSSCGHGNFNLLQCAVIDNKNLETHKIIWQVICKYCDADQILKFIEHCDSDGDNLLCSAVSCNTKEIVEFTWNQIKKFKIAKEVQFEYLNRKGHDDKNVRQLSLEKGVKDSQVVVYVEQIMLECQV